MLAPAQAIQAGSTVDALLKIVLLPPLEMRILLCHALSLSRVQLITQSQRALNETEAQRLSALIERRLRGEPIAYLVGEREFYGLPFHVTPAVLIPRPETELLVDLGLARLPPGSRMLDMGTGSGAIAIAIAQQRADVDVTALDASATALAIAQKNAARHGVTARLVQSDWYQAVGAERFDLIVSNPPYIHQGDLHLEQGDLRFEPVDALTDHADGLSALRTIIQGAAAHLSAGGWLLLEHGYDQAHAVRELLAGYGFQDVRSWTDLAGIERVSGGARAA